MSEGQDALTLHVDPSLNVDIAVSASALPRDALPGSLVAIRPVVPVTSKGKQVDRPLLYRVGSNDEGERKRGKTVTVNGHVQQGVKWIKNRVQIELSLVDDEEEWHATYCDIHFQNIYLGRPDMLRTALALNDAPLFSGQRVSLPGSSARLRIGAMRTYKSAVSAILSSETRISWRSESGRVFLFVEVSAEMSQFEEDGSMLKEKCDEFMNQLSEHLQGTSHVLTVVLYGRVIYDSEEEGYERRAPMNKDEDGRWYRDFFKVVADLTSDPTEVAALVSSEMRKWHSEVLLRTSDNGREKLAGRIAYAHESPILEAANLALNSFEEHWVDRDLQRTGLQLLVITAGTSYYNVPKKLLRMTTERMLYHGIGLDLISLSKTPLHAVPLFAFKSQEPGLSETSMPSDQQDPLYYDPAHDSQEQSVYYTSPLFVFTSFFGFQPDKPHRIDRFMPRARCYSLSSQGVGERVQIAIPPSKPMGDLEREQYDLSVIGATRDKTTWKDSGASNEVTSGSGYGGHGSLSRQDSAEQVDSDPAEFIERGRSKHAVRRTPRKGSGASRSRTPVRSLQQKASRDVSPASRPGSLTARAMSPISRARSPSISSAMTTASKGSKDAQTRKLPTPALISRLAPQPSTGKAAKGWLGFFKAPQSHTRNAPSVSVQKVSASALPITKATTDDKSVSLTGSEIGSAGASTELFTKPVPRSPVSPPAPEPANRPTQPISIASKTASKSENAAQEDNRGSYKPREDLKISNAKSFGSFNPSKPMRRNRGLIEQQRRWANVFVRHENDQRSVNWVSITRGACLPIATDYLPTMDALKNLYTDYRYSIPLTSVDSSFILRHDTHRSHAFELILEMACQRVAQGFQICTPANAIGALDELNPATDKTVTDVLRDMDAGESSALYFSLSRTIQRISYDRRTHCVLVKVMRKKRSWKKTPVGHAALVWSQGATAWAQKTFDFPYPLMIEPEEWEHIDRIVAGIEEADQRKFLRYWRTRLVLLPGDSVPDRSYLLSKIPALALEGEVSDEDIQLQGFFALMETIQNLRWSPKGVEKPATPTELTHLSPPDWAAKTARAQAVQALQPVLASGAPQPGAPAVRSSRWLRRVTSPPTRDESVNSSNGRGKSADANEEEPISSARLESLIKRQTVQMSWSVILDLDPQQKSDRAERVQCHFDRSHNPSTAYHIELAWLSGSGRVIHTTIQQWMRQMSRYGLNLVEATSRSVESDHNPFVKAHLIPLAAPPPQLVEGMPHHFYQQRLLGHLDFFLDIGAESTFPSTIDVEYSYRRRACENSQFVHRTGTLLASVCDDGIYAAANRIYTVHSGKSATEHFDRLKALCQDAPRLAELWQRWEREYIEASL